MTDTFTSDSGVKYDIVWNGTVNKITGDGFEKTVTNIPIYVLQKSSQSREVQEESTSPTESEKKDFGMIDNIIDGIRNDIKDHGFRRNDLRDIVKSFLSSNGYL